MPLPSKKASPMSTPYGSTRFLLEADSLTKTNFPSTFQDFFCKLSDTGDDSDEITTSLLEDKQLLPSKEKDEESVTYKERTPERYWSMNKKSFRRRHNELQTKAVPRSEGKVIQQKPHLGHGSSSAYSSPKISRRRSSSIAISRSVPDTNRFPTSEHTKQRLNMRQRSSPERCHSYSNTPTKSPRPQRYSPIAAEIAKYRGRTASVPAVPSRHNPMLAQTKRNEPGVEYYRLRSFSITPEGVFNLGDSFKSRRSRSVSSVNSAESAQTDAGVYNRERLPSATSQLSSGAVEETNEIPTYTVAMLGASGVGKTTLTYQFTTSEYACAYDASLDDEFGQKTVSVMLNGQETELEIIDHPSAEMSIETFCSTYTPDVCVVVYSIEDRRSIKVAEDMLMYLWKSDFMSSIGVILVGNKADLERSREIPTSVGRKLADECRCKFIETSSGLDHNVDELLVGILAQVSLNPKRRRFQFSKKKNRFESGKKFLKCLLGMKRKSRSCENLFKL